MLFGEQGVVILVARFAVTFLCPGVLMPKRSRQIQNATRTDNNMWRVTVLPIDSCFRGTSEGFDHLTNSKPIK